MARAFTGRSGVISFSGAFHGRTLLGMALTGKVAPYKKGFGAMPPEIVHAPFPNDFHGVSEPEAIASLERLFASSVDPERVAAIIIEPAQETERRDIETTFALHGFDHAGVAPD